MLQVHDEEGLRRQVGAWRAEGEVIAFVPTMGALHAGHLSLLRLARERAGRGGRGGRGEGAGSGGKVLASIFVNPTQFGPGEDFDRYPRTLARDADLLERAGCDLLFAPPVDLLYPPGHAIVVDPAGPALGLEGERRPGHFRGVATVVCGLFGLVRPDLAVFGEKDAQQLAVVRRMVRDLHLGVEIVAGPTVREPDGLAMSSRNAFLGEEDRRAAGVLHRALTAAAAAIEKGERQGDAVRRLMAEVVAGEPRAVLDYADVVDAGTFHPLAELSGRLVLPIAARFGTTRLIDNLQLTLAAGA
jgi:pantoate--beta-alanine ligase